MYFGGRCLGNAKSRRTDSVWTLSMAFRHKTYLPGGVRSRSPPRAALISSEFIEAGDYVYIKSRMGCSAVRLDGKWLNAGMAGGVRLEIAGT